MGPLGNWIANPNTALAFNVGRAGIATGASLIPTKSQSVDVGRSYRAAAAPFNAALDMQEQALMDQYNQYEQQATTTEQEANFDADQKARSVDEFAQDQTLRYLGSGVTLAGSPAVVIDRTRRQGAEEVNALRRRGQATAAFLRATGAMQRNQGKAAIIGERAKFDFAALQAEQEAAQGAIPKQSKATSALNAISDLFKPAASTVPRQALPKLKRGPSSGIPIPSAKQAPALGYIHPFLGDPTPQRMPYNRYHRNP